MRGKAYLAMGGVSMGIAGSVVDQPFFEETLGMRVESVDMSLFAGRMRDGVYDAEELGRALAWTRANCREREDANERPQSREEKDRVWEDSVKMALIARDLMVGNPALAEKHPEEARGHNAIAGGFQGQRSWTDHFPNGDLMEAVLCSSFDWDGVRQPFTVATENDALNGVSMLFGHLLTGAAQLFADVRTHWSPDAVERVTGWRPQGGFLHLINSGPAALDWTGHGLKPWWEVTPEDAARCLEETRWGAGSLGYFPGGGWSTDLTTAGGRPATMCRLNLVKGLGPVLQIAEGETLALPEGVHDALDARTDPTWPTTWFAPRLTGEGAFRDAYAVMAHWGANHAAVAPGHVGADLVTLAVDAPRSRRHAQPSRTSRSSARRRGTASGAGLDAVGADFRACAAYGPLYK